MKSQRVDLSFLDQIPPKDEVSKKLPLDPDQFSLIEQPKLRDCFISSDVKLLKLLQ